MTSTLAPSRPASRTPIHDTGASARHRRAGLSRDAQSDPAQRTLGRYIDREGRVREVVTWSAAKGSVLVADREASTWGDCRLVAHLAADEPAENAEVVCAHYLHDVAEESPRCRLVTPEDGLIVPFAEYRQPDLACDRAAADSQIFERAGCAFRIELIGGTTPRRELRWCRRSTEWVPAGHEPVSLREVVACAQSYEPMCTLTVSALALHQDTGEISTAVLRSELARVQESPIVLNRRLREVVRARVTRHELSMSEIAIRCGRVKRDRKGNESGETSWLGRRIGLLPEGGRSTPTPWIHSDVLGLIARRGLGISPREVELG
jgi:hypothetical protein